MFDGFFGFPKYQKQHRMGSQNIMNRGKMQIFTSIFPKSVYNSSVIVYNSIIRGTKEEMGNMFKGYIYRHWLIYD